MGKGGAISERVGGRSARAGVVFCAVFAVIGAGIAVSMLFTPVSQMVRARSWVRTPCTILASEVASRSGEDGAVYSAAIRYRYTRMGREYESRRYQFTKGETGRAERAGE